MKFTLDSGSKAHLIRGYSDTQIRIGELVLVRTCIVMADRLISDFAPQSFSEFALEHLAVLFELAPELVILGTGPTQRFAAAPLRDAFAARGIGLEAMQLGAACRTYNVLVQEERRVAAALFLR